MESRNVRASLAAALMAAVALALAAPAAQADDEAALKAKVAELEKQQAEMQKQMQMLLRRLEAKEASATPATPTAAAPKATTPKATAAPVTVSAPAPAAPATGEVTADGRVAEVERKQDVITEEVRKLKEALVLPEHQELKSMYGFGPAASKVYTVPKGISLASYGEFNYKNAVSDRGTSARDDFDFLRLVLYTGYKYNDRILFNSEIEFEHGTTGKNGSVSVEFASMDFFLHEKVNARAGLLLVPMGFVNEIHEPPFFHGNLRPVVEQQILPSTWRSGGAGLFGELLPGLDYRTYVVTSFDAKGFRSSGVRGGRQSGSIEKAEDFAWVGRLDYGPVEQLQLGASAYVGNSGQDQSYGNNVDGFTKPDVLTQIYEVHGQFKWRGFESRVLGAWINLDDAAVLSLDSTINPGATDPTKKDQPVAGSQYGWYAEVAYNVLPLVLPDSLQYLAPWFRYSKYNTQDDVPTGFTADETQDRDVYEVGLSWKPIPEVVIKLDYRNQDAKSGNLPDEVRLGAGFVY